jgi:O-antigen ligase
MINFAKPYFLKVLRETTLAELVFGALVVSLFLNVKIPLTEDFSFYLGEKKDFFIIFAYLSDITTVLLASLLIYVLFTRRFYRLSLNKPYTVLVLAPYLIAGLAVISYYFHFSNLIIPAISTYYLLLLAKGVVLHETGRRWGRRFMAIILPLFLFLIGLEVVLGVYQFSQQRDFGLQIIGESIIGPYLYGPAKVEALGQVFVRAYGSFPHPNVFAAFLVVGLCLALKFTIEKAALAGNKTYLFGILIVNLLVLGLILSFSRAAWLAGALAFVALAVFTWNKALPAVKARLSLIFGSVIIFIGVTVWLLMPLVQQRGNVFDKAYKERRSYNRVALEMIQQSPIFGLGPGESLLHMEQGLGVGLEPWQVQPIHNYYLLLAAEIGVPALLLFLYYLFVVGWGGLRRVFARSAQNPNLPYLLAGLGACCVLMLFDHYFYTIQPTILLFWLWLGLTAGEVAHETDKIAD